MSPIIAQAKDAEAIQRCHPVMVQLRPHLTDGAVFVERVLRQQQGGYQLVYLEADDQVRAVAGYRFLECLAWGRVCYVDDLVTDAAVRSQGCGQQLFAWLVDSARAAGCDQLHLDSGVHRFGAHRFYLGQRMDITCHHFALPLRAAP
jgi:GNAT superfamily N-acetyltransferase